MVVSLQHFNDCQVIFQVKSCWDSSLNFEHEFVVRDPTELHVLLLFVLTIQVSCLLGFIGFVPYLLEKEGL